MFAFDRRDDYTMGRPPDAGGEVGAVLLPFNRNS